MSSCECGKGSAVLNGDTDVLEVKQFIRNVRASKTIADERGVVQKESAAIRASFREESGDHNVRYVVTLLSIGIADRAAGETMLPSSCTFSLSVNGHTSAR